MTRFTKIARKKHLDATPWSAFKNEQQTADEENIEDSQSTDNVVEEPTPREEQEESTSCAENQTNKETKTEHTANQNDGESEAKKQKQVTEQGNYEEKMNEKLQKRRLARKLRRQKMKKCFSCRESGHGVKDCPLNSTTESSVCYHCASTEHTTKKCPHSSEQQTKDNGQFSFAICFICKEKGHIARACPQNPRGLYPDGGGCKMCGSVEHFKKDCPELLSKKQQKPGSVVKSWKKDSGHFSIDSLDEVEGLPKEKRTKKKKKTVVKF